MANYGIFIGFGTTARGREAKALEVFGEATQYNARLQQEGRIESWEAVLLEPHGGDLDGFVLLRGDKEKLAQIRVDPEFERLTTRSLLYVDNFGVVGAYIGEGFTETLTRYQEALGELP